MLQAMHENISHSWQFSYFIFSIQHVRLCSISGSVASTETLPILIFFELRQESEMIMYSLPHCGGILKHPYLRYKRHFTVHNIIMCKIHPVCPVLTTLISSWFQHQSRLRFLCNAIFQHLIVIASIPGFNFSFQFDIRLYNGWALKYVDNAQTHKSSTNPQMTAQTRSLFSIPESHLLLQEYAYFFLKNNLYKKHQAGPG